MYSFKMPVYLIAWSATITRSLSFAELWIRAIKGEVDHVEVAFVRNRVLYSCYITRYSITAKFEEHNLKEFTDNGTITWYQLDVSSLGGEMELEARCTRLVGSDDYFFSQTKLIRSALPFRSAYIERLLAKLVEPQGDRSAQFTPEQRIHAQRAEKSAVMDHRRSTYCAALCSDILGFPDHETRTASDVVILCVQRLNAVIVDQPVPNVRHQPVRDDANIIRSSEFFV